MYKIKNLAEKTLNKKLLEEFLSFANKKLGVDQPYSVYFVDDKVNAADPLGKTAMYNPSSNSVYVYATNRHPKDILRSIAHELMHHKQNCDGRLDKTYGEGSVTEKQLELEANEAGYLVRQFEDGRKNVNEQVAPRRKQPFPKTAPDYGQADTELSTSPNVRLRQTRGLTRGSGPEPRVTKLGTFRYPKPLNLKRFGRKGYQVAPNWNKPPKDWDLNDVLAARSDIWFDNWKTNEPPTKTDSVRPIQKKNYSSVYTNIKDRNIKYLIFNQMALYKLVKNMNIAKNLPDLPDYQKIPDLQGYNQQLLNHIKKPKNMKIYIDLVKRFASSDWGKSDDVKKLLFQFTSVYKELVKDSEQDAKKAYNAAINIINKANRKTTEGAEKVRQAIAFLEAYRDKGQETPRQGTDTGPEDEQTGDETEIPTFEEFQKGFVNPAFKKSLDALDAIKALKTNNIKEGKNSSLSEQDKQRPVANDKIEKQKRLEAGKEKSKFHVYTLPETDAAYSVLKLASNRVMRLGVADPIHGFFPSSADAGAIQIPQPLQADLLKLAFNLKKGDGDLAAGDSPFTKLDRRVSAIYAQSPYGFKSTRAINQIEDKYLKDLVVILSIIGAVPVGPTWIADIMAASILFSQGKYSEGAVYALFPMFFAPVSKDLKAFYASATNKLGGGSMGRQISYEKAYNFLRELEIKIGSQEFKNYDEFLRRLEGLKERFRSFKDRIENTIRGADKDVVLSGSTEMKAFVEKLNDALKQVEGGIEVAVKEAESQRNVLKTLRELTTEVGIVADKASVAQAGKAASEAFETLGTIRVGTKEYPASLKLHKEYLERQIEKQGDDVMAELVKDRTFYTNAEQADRLINNYTQALEVKAIKKGDAAFDAAALARANETIKTTNEAIRRTMLERELDALSSNPRFMNNLEASLRVELPDVVMSRYKNYVEETRVSLFKPNNIKKLPEQTQKEIAGLLDRAAKGESISSAEIKELAKKIQDRITPEAERLARLGEKELKKVQNVSQKDLLDLLSLENYERVIKPKSLALRRPIPLLSKTLEEAEEIAKNVRAKSLARAKASGGKAFTAIPKRIGPAITRALGIYGQKGTGTLNRFASQYLGRQSLLFLPARFLEGLTVRALKGRSKAVAWLLGKIVYGIGWLLFGKIHYPLLAYVRFYQPYCEVGFTDYIKTVFGILVTKPSALINPLSVNTIYEQYSYLTAEHKKLFGEDYSPTKSVLFNKHCKDVNAVANIISEASPEKLKKIYKDAMTDAQSLTDDAKREWDNYMRKAAKATGVKVNEIGKKASDAKKAAVSAAQTAGKAAQGAAKLASDAAAGDQKAQDLITKQAEKLLNEGKKKGDALLKQNLLKTKQEATKSLQQHKNDPQLQGLFGSAPKPKQESVSISDYRQKLLEDRLVKLTIGLRK